MKFARLIEERSLDAAIAAARSASAAGFSGIWLAEDAALPDPRLVAGSLWLPELTTVLLVDPGADATWPAGLDAELAVHGSSGWRERMGAMLEKADRPPGRAWVVASDVSTVAAAAKSGAGAAFSPFENPDAAAEWVSEYDSELESGSARAEFGTVTASCAVLIDAGNDPDALIGLIERYREAGLDEVILRGVLAGDPDFTARVFAEFDAEDVRSDAAERSRRRQPAISAIERAGDVEEAGAIEDGSEGEQRSRRGGRVAAITRSLGGLQESAVRRMSDRQLEAVVGNRVAVRLLFHSMAARYRPEKAGGFTGPIEFTFTTPHGDEVWTIDCGANGAKARRGATPSAKLRVGAKLADFLRVGVGEIAAPSAVLAGKLDIRGDFGLALRMGEMFGGPAIV